MKSCCLRRVAAVLSCALCCPPTGLSAADCDANGAEDALELADGRAADCNGNGIPDACDLAPARRGFTVPGESPLDGTPSFLAGADIDGDGDVDAAVGLSIPGQSPGSLLVLENGEGAFSPTTSSGLIDDPARGEAFFADLDGDSRLDAVIAYRGSPAIQVLANAGGELAAPARVIDSTVQLTALAAGDLDGDGDLDLAAASEAEIVILDGAGGAFTRRQAVAVEAHLQALAAGDLDGDGDPDLAAAVGSPPGLAVFRNESGTLSKQPPVDLRWVPNRLALTDLDGDGDRDLFAGGLFSEDLAVLTNDGNGSLTVLRERRGLFLGQILPADVDDDGDIDIVLPVSWQTCSGIGLSILHNQGDAEFAIDFLRPLADLQSGSFLADVDRDGFLDLVAVRRQVVGGEGKIEGRLTVIRAGTVRRSEDCDGNAIPDECDLREADCNWNGLVDACEIRSGAQADCDGNLRPDECDRDCNRNSIPDPCDLAGGSSADVNASGIPDECEPGELAGGEDCNANGVPDASELAAGSSPDCNSNGVPDQCDLAIFRAQNAPPFQLDFCPGQGALADLNGDGRDDLVLGSCMECCAAADTFLAVFLTGARTGSWTEAGRYFGVPKPTAIVPVDIDGDADLDLVTASRRFGCVSPGKITLLLNEGRGAFVTGPVLGLGMGMEVAALAALDFDRDGDVDLGAIDQKTPASSLILFRGGGRGDFAPGPALILPGLGLAVASEDFDQDDLPDLVTTATVDGTSGTLEVHRNEGGGVFRLAHSWPLTGYPSALRVLDLEGDGFHDLLVGRSASGPALALFRGLEGGAFLEPRILPLTFTPDIVVAYDQDLDGDADVAIAGSIFIPGVSPGQQVLSLLRNRGGGEFSRLHGLLHNVWTTFLADGDLDDDGDRDLLVTDVVSQSVIVFENRGQGRFGGTARLSTGVRPLAIVHADFEGDGSIDLATANEGSLDLSLIANQGEGAFGLGLDIPLEFAPRSLVAADLDRDGSPDLAAAGAFQIAWILNRGNDAFARGGQVRIGSNPVALAATDLNGDGFLDLATANSLSSGFEDNVSVILNDSQGSFASPRNFAAGLGVSAIAAGDFDGDGDVDLAVPNLGSSEIAILWNDGRGAFARDVKVPVPDAGAVDGLLAADVDGDQDMDLIGKSGSWRRISVAANLGAGEFALQPYMDLAAEDWQLGSFEWTFGASDMDGDGDPDLVVASHGAINVSRNTAGRFTLWPETLTWEPGPLGGQGGSGDPAPPNRVGLALADLDGDGDADPAVSLELPNSVHFFFNRLESASPDRDRNGVPDECEPPPPKLFRRGDVDGGGVVNISDPVLILRHLFATGGPLACRDAADADDDGGLNVTDPIRILGHLFLGEPPLPEPFAACGIDGSPDDIECERFPPCSGD